MHLGGGGSNIALDLLKLSVDQSVTSEISGFLAASNRGFSIDPCVSLGFLISQGSTPGAFPMRSLALLGYISGIGALWSFKLAGNL